MLSFNSPTSRPPSRVKPTVVLESGLAGPPQAWLPVARLLDADFRVVIHRRANGASSLKTLAEQLHTVLRHPPYLLAAHSFGALVARQFAASYPTETAGIVFVDALPVTTEFHLGKVIATVRFAKLLATLGLIAPALPWAAKNIRMVGWATAEIDKLPGSHRILSEWTKPQFYSSIATLLTALPRNLQTARDLQIPPHIPTLSLHSDYPDPQGRRIENSGHWIQVDQPEAVASAVRELARMA